MRILQVISTFYPSLAFGGPAKVAYGISKELAARGHEVEVFATNAYDQTQDFKPKSKETVLHGFKVTYFNNLVKFGNIFVSTEMNSALRKRVKEFDVIHAHYGRQGHDIIMSNYARKHAVPYVLQPHGSLPRIMAMQASKLSYDIFFGNRIMMGASKVIALSQREADQAKAFGVSDKRIAIVPNGINLTEYENFPSKGSFKKKYCVANNKKIILYLGRIHITKRIDLLIKAYAHYIKTIDHNNTILVIAGPDDGYLAETISLADSLGILDSVCFTGFIDDDDKLGAFVDASLFVTPSFYGFPMTFLEACLAGLPIVTTNFGDSLDWIDDIVGEVTSPTESDLATALQLMLSDSTLLQQYSMNGKELVKSKFSINATVDKLVQIYEDAARR